MKPKYWVLITAIISITILEGLALWKQVDGQALSVAVAAVAGIAGYRLAVANRT